MVARTDALIARSGLSYRRAGAGAPLVLVHGYLGGSAQWQAELARFSDRFDVIAPDLPGYAGSAGLPPPERIAAFAAAVVALLDELGIGRFTLMGHSMGGMIVQELAATHPDRIARLILYGTGPLGAMPNRFEPLETSRARLRSDGVAQTIRRIGATWFRQGAAAEGFEIVAELGAQATEAAALAGLDAMSHWDGRGALGRLTMPTLVLWGDGDRSYRWPQVETLWQGLPDAALAVVPGTAHAVHLEKPALFHALVEDFVTG
ncbi:putative hydrolase or acyltransferase (alpha/beta hydrolase superfamily) [Roseovarius mucosus DSM 17069]|uniref:Putative hydrolase or acyltransferase (Alpha/beta hydrolase superfamily) n=1 Tax=Roseovarius mucosus DSM 17069 TaxID=1288298 RepID=A0A0A0HRH8_9RHOB|nr:alpha/beta hydrolase [Roseovarius mucosus]KGM89224.1 putative hydrolase or acyltransferase (alpha/beta hydrolase superfamily) [Roseovarius mucosus DSM 17069]